jgi:ankyrin repeat protein
MKSYICASISLGALLLLTSCTPSPKDGARFCESVAGIRKYLETTDADPNLQVTVSRAGTSEGEQIQSLLDCAVRSSDISLVKLLLAKGIDVNGHSRGGITPLHNAPSLGMAEFLISRGADVNAQANGGSTPLFWAQSYEIAQLLIDRGANIKTMNQQGQTVLHRFAGSQAIDDKDREENLKISQLLIRQGANVNAVDIDGNAPLHEVSDSTITELLIAHGAQLNTRNRKFQTPVHKVTARSCRNSAVLDVLLRKGADVNVQDNMGKTPLHISIEVGGAYCKDRIFTLLKYGASVDLKDKSGSSPLSQALHNYKQSIEPLKEMRGLPESYQKVVLEEESIINALEEQRYRLKN